MASTTFVNNQTLVPAEWLNDVNTTAYKTYVNVRQSPYNATGNGTTDDYAAIQAAITANPGKEIFFPPGIYKITQELVVTGDNTTINLGYSYLRQATNNVNTITFKPTTAGTTAAFLNYPTIKNGIIYPVNPDTTGNSLELRQCNNPVVENIVINEGDFTVYGGQLGLCRGCSFYASAGSSKGTGSALVHFREAPYGGGSYQPCFTFIVESFRASSSKKRDAIFRIYNGDGVFIKNGYAAYGLTSIVLVLGERNGGYVSACGVSGMYLDSGNTATGTTNGLEFRADGNSSFNVYEFSVDNCKFGNGPGSAILCRKPQLNDLNVTNSWFGNYVTWAIDLEMGTLGTPNIEGCIFNDNGTNGVSGTIRLSGGNTYNLVGNIFNNNLNVVVNASGTWVAGNLTGNVNSGTIADINISGATYTDKLYFSGNTSKYAFPGTQYSWVGTKSKYTDYADNAAALAGGLVSGCVYQTSGTLKVVT